MGDTQMQTQGDLLNKQKMLRSTELRRRRHPVTRCRSDFIGHDISVVSCCLLLRQKSCGW